MPKTTIMEDAPPTVQVTLLQAPQPSPAPQAPTPPLQPRTAMKKASLPPPPQLRPNRVSPPTPPLQTSRLLPPPIQSPPLTPPNPAKPILRDTRASQAMRARTMMKMRAPSQVQHTSPSLPTVDTRTHSETRVLPPLPRVNKERSVAQRLPAPSARPTRPTLTATPPTHTGSTMTRPTIISSSRPVYPRVARESGWEGTVIVRTRIDTNGNPNQVNIHKSCGHPTLDQAAQDAVTHWTFQPAKDGNIPITKWVDIPINFDLNS